MDHSSKDDKQQKHQIYVISRQKPQWVFIYHPIALLLLVSRGKISNLSCDYRGTALFVQ